MCDSRVVMSIARDDSPQFSLGMSSRLPVIPDLRFEQSYLRSIAAYTSSENIDWKGVFWITARDQVISPLLQGTVW